MRTIIYVGILLRGKLMVIMISKDGGILVAWYSEKKKEIPKWRQIIKLLRKDHCAFNYAFMWQDVTELGLYFFIA